MTHMIYPTTNFKATEQLQIDRGEGVYVYDSEGKRYLEGMSGLWCTSLGYGNRELIETASEQMAKLPYSHLFGGKTHAPAMELADRISEMVPVPDAQVFLGNSGSDANDSHIKRCALTLEESELSGKLTIAAPPAFTNLWLMPRIAELLERFPDLELHFEYMPPNIPAALPNADLVVQFGKHNWPRKRIVPLAITDYQPYCSPRLLGRLDRAAPAALTEHVLIHDDDGGAWAQWLAVAGMEELKPQRDIYVNNSIDALELARQGVGLTINDQIVTSHWVKQGHLIAPFRPVLSSFERFYIVTPHEKQMNPATREFELWLQQRLAEDA